MKTLKQHINEWKVNSQSINNVDKKQVKHLPKDKEKLLRKLAVHVFEYGFDGDEMLYELLVGFTNGEDIWNVIDLGVDRRSPCPEEWFLDNYDEYEQDITRVVSDEAKKYINYLKKNYPNAFDYK